jgi:hypothetical protein
MTTAVVDTNILVRGAIAAGRRSPSKRVVDAFFAGRFVLILSRETLLEIRRVLAQPDVRAKHGWSEDKISRFCRALEVGSRVLDPMTRVPASLTRDVTDTKWLGLALDGDADYLVTHDNRHLLRLKKVGRTLIVRPHVFLQALRASKR